MSRLFTLNSSLYIYRLGHACDSAWVHAATVAYAAYFQLVLVPLEEASLKIRFPTLMQVQPLLMVVVVVLVLMLAVLLLLVCCPWCSWCWCCWCSC